MAGVLALLDFSQRLEAKRCVWTSVEVLTNVGCVLVTFHGSRSSGGLLADGDNELCRASQVQFYVETGKSFA